MKPSLAEKYLSATTAPPLLAHIRKAREQKRGRTWPQAAQLGGGKKTCGYWTWFSLCFRLLLCNRTPAGTAIRPRSLRSSSLSTRWNSLRYGRREKSPGLATPCERLSRGGRGAPWYETRKDVLVPWHKMPVVIGDTEVEVLTREAQVTGLCLAPHHEVVASEVPALRSSQIHGFTPVERRPEEGQVEGRNIPVHCIRS
jgi:hypothetical protein